MTHSMQAAMKNCNNIQQRTKGKKQKKTKGIELMIFFVWILNESWKGREVHL